MTRLFVVAVFGLMLLVPMASFAQEAWLLLYRSGRYELALANDSGIVTVADAGELKSYGESASVIALISRNAETNGFELRLVDKRTHAVLSSRTVSGFVPTRMSGPTNDVVILSDTAYFVTLRLTDSNTISLNSEGGRLDLNAVNISSGTQVVVPLPEECETARLVDYGGALLIYAWNGYGVWELNPTANSLERRVSWKDVEDILGSEQTVTPMRDRAGPFADQVAIQGGGVFRLSKRGRLERVLDGQLRPISAPHAGLDLRFDLGEDGEYAHLVSTIINGRAFIGAIGQRGPTSVYELFDADGLTTEWTTQLPNTVILPTISPVSEHSLVYIDSASSAVVLIEAGKTKTLWSFKGLQPSVNPLPSSIISTAGIP